MRHRPRPPLSALVRALAAAFACGAAGAQQPGLPVNPSVVSGQVSVRSPSAQQLVVNQQSSRAVVNWNSFSVDSGSQVNFVQPGSNSAILNRVTGATPSSIAGQINANGQVFLVNPNGIEITPTGVVRAAGMTLSALDIVDSDFLAGRLSFAGGGASAMVSNRGTITGTPGGFAALLGGQVSNDGRIDVPLGRIGAGAGERATLDLLGSRFLQVAMPTARNADGKALVEVAGQLSAEGGRIEVSAATAREALRQAVNIPGSLVARSVAGRSGDIVLSAGSGGGATVSGVLDVSGADTSGGSVTVTGDSITLQRAHIDASGAAGGGRVQLGGGAQGQGPLPHARQLQLDGESVVNADAMRDGPGGHIVLWSDLRTDFRGTLSARGAGGGAGGFAEVSSGATLEYTGRTDLRAARGGAGTLLLDPFDVTISAGADTGACCTAAANNTVINTTTLANALASANVTVSTGAGGAQAGDITVASPVAWNSGNTLTLSAARDINVNAALSGSGSLQLNAGRNVAVNKDITASGGPLNVGLAASPAAGTITINNATIDTGGGNLSATAKQTGASAIVLTNATLDVGTGSGTLAGLSDVAAGVLVNGSMQLRSSGAGSLTLSGTSVDYAGVLVSAGAAVSAIGNANLFGNAANWTGVLFMGGNMASALNGTFTITGTSTNWDGLGFNPGATTLTQAGPGALLLSGHSTAFHGAVLVGAAALGATGNVQLAGSSVSESGIRIDPNASINANGSVAVSGSSGSAEGIALFGGNTITAAGGSLALSGISGSGPGFSVTGAAQAVASAGSLTLSGASTSNNGFEFKTGASFSSAGAVTLSGTSLNGGSGFSLRGSNTVTVNSGNTTITGTAASAFNAIDMASGGNSLVNNGTGTLTLNGNGNVALAAPITSASGSLAISATRDLLLNSGTQINWAAGTTQTLDAGRDINVNAALSGSGSLQLNAGRDIAVNGNIAASGGPLNVGLAASPTAGTISINSAAIDTGGGNLTATATQTGPGNALLLGNTTLNVGSGTGTLTMQASGDAAFAWGNLNLLASGAGSLTLSSTSNAGSGLFFNTNTALTTAGTVSVTGASTGNTGLFFLGSSSINAGSGSLWLNGSSAGNMGVWFNGGNNTLVAIGGLSINGTSTCFRGLGFNSGVSVVATGNIDLSGTSTSGRGLWFNGSNTISASNGTLALAGTSSSADAVFINFGPNSFTQSGAGSIKLTGNSATATGLLFNTAVSLATSGNVTLNGNSSSATGVALLGGNALTAGGGSLALSGGSGSSSGVQFSGADSLTNAGGSVTVTGASSSGIGIGLSAGAALTTAGDMTLNGNATASGGRGVQFDGAALTVSSGTLALAGSALDSAGIAFSTAATSTMANNGAGLGLAGSSNSGPGVLVNASHVLHTTGDVTLSGSGSSTGISLTSGATVDNTGGGTLHLAAVGGGIDLGSNLISPNGALWLTSGGNVTQASGSVAANTLLLSGPGLYTLEAGGNQLQTVAANVGAIGLRSATDLTVGSVLGTPGVTSSGVLTLRSDGNLTITAGAPVSGASPVLAAGGAFVNNAGAGALSATSGRWLVYAADPSTSSFGGLDSGRTALWNATYALTPPGTVGASGNRYLFALQPSLTFSPVDASKTYGDDATGAIQSSFAVAGFHSGVANAFMPDTAATAYTGAGLLASPGATTTAGMAAGPYALAVSSGTLSSPAGYAFAFSGSASLTVTPRPMTVSASTQSRWYGDANPPLTYMVSAGNLVNGDTLGGSLGTTALASSPVGAYGIGQGTLSAGGNYTLSYVPASLNVLPRPTAVDAGMASRVSAQPGAKPGFDGAGDEPLDKSWTNGNLTPADPARYIVLMVDDLPPPVPSRQLQADSASKVMAAVERQHRLKRVATWPIPSVEMLCVLYRLPEGGKAEDLLGALRRDRRVRAAEPLHDFAPLADAPVSPYNDPYVDMQRGFAAIGAARAHRLSVGRNTAVAVVDTAVDLAHPDLRGRIAGSRDMVETGAHAEPQQARHGTEVAGIIAASANNGEGIVGIAPAADLSVYRACWYPAANAAARCNTFTLAKALGEVLRSGARIVNLSLGGPADSVLELLLRRMIVEGRIVVAALPLSGRAEGFPAAVPGVLVVGSTDKGPPPNDVLAAPGRDLLTLVPGGRYDFGSGSSLAAAHVSGAVALLLSMEPTLSADEVRKVLFDSAASPSRAINAEAAVNSLQQRRQNLLTRQH